MSPPSPEHGSQCEELQMGQEARGGGQTEASAWCSDGQRSSQGCGSSVVLTKDKAVVHRNNFVSFGNLQLGFWSSVTTCSKKKSTHRAKKGSRFPLARCPPEAVLTGTALAHRCSHVQLTVLRLWVLRVDSPWMPTVTRTCQSDRTSDLTKPRQTQHSR